MKQIRRKVKRKLAMALSMLLIVGSIAGTMSMQVMAENNINTGEESLTETPEAPNGDVDTNKEINADENININENENANKNENNTFDDGKIPDDTVTSDEQEEDEVQTDVPIDDEEDTADLYMEEGEAYQTVRKAKQAEAEVSYSTDGGSTWEQDDLVNVLWNCFSASSVEIKLLKDVTLAENWNGPQRLAFSNQKVTLDGQGHMLIRGRSNDVIINDQPGAELILKNITIDGGAVWSGTNPAERQNTGVSANGNDHLIWVYGGGTLVLDEGAVIQNSHMTGNYYGAIQVGNDGSGGTLVMKSGSEIRNCMAEAGAAVNIQEGGFFRMEGGKIYNNYASVYGGSGVNCYGSFSMSGGEISGNTADNLGGGVCVMGSGTASMSGGSISGNHSKKYGGGIGIRDNGNFSMTAGSIESNTAAANGGGIAVFHDTSVLNISGGSIGGNTGGNNGGGVFVYQGQIKMEGNPVITGNTMNGTANNLYLSSGRTIGISGALGESAAIGVTANEGIISSGWNAQMGADKKAGDYFSSDSEQLTVDMDTTSNEVRLSAKTAGDKGTITEEVKREENAPEVKVPVWPEGLEEAVLTDDEKALVANGADVVIRLIVADAENSVDESDKRAVETALNGSTPVNGYTKGQYLDVSLFKVIEGTSSPITETVQKITITITIPDSLKNTDSAKTRTYAVIRVHNDEVAVLNDTDNSADTITIETDRFSTYAIVYKDTANAGKPGDGGNSGGNAGGDTGDNGNGGSDNHTASSGNNSNTLNSSKPSNQSKNKEPKTGDNTPLELYATLAMIGGLAYLLLYFADRRRGMTEETKKELVSGLVEWAKQGGKIRKAAVLAAIFALLVYYHSIGKKTAVEWKAVYGE